MLNTCFSSGLKPFNHKDSLALLIFVSKVHITKSCTQQRLHKQLLEKAGNHTGHRGGWERRHLWKPVNESSHDLRYQPTA